MVGEYVQFTLSNAICIIIIILKFMIEFPVILLQYHSNAFVGFLLPFCSLFNINFDSNPWHKCQCLSNKLVESRIKKKQPSLNHTLLAGEKKSARIWDMLSCILTIRDWKLMHWWQKKKYFDRLSMKAPCTTWEIVECLIDISPG